MDGVLIINKPGGMTSHDVVARVRRICGEKSVGHLGTLDPTATGVLPLVLGRFTRLAQFYTDSDKRYEGAIRFGQATDTYDAAGDPTGPELPVNLALQQIQAAAAGFTGKIQQMPPPFSAKKIAGVPAYKLARKGQEVELKPKEVEVKDFEILDWDPESKIARFKAWVSSGTYLRSMAHDLGKVLGTGAHLSALVRTAVREFDLENAHTLEELAEAMASSKMDELFLHPRLILPEFPAVMAPPEAQVRLKHGGAVNLPEFSKASMVRVFAGQRELLAIAKR
ncbi:MAG: tRNA pseudouridine(55) synthase TruB, partial [Terriglobales bacterium]